MPQPEAMHDCGGVTLPKTMTITSIYTCLWWQPHHIHLPVIVRSPFQMYWMNLMHEWLGSEENQVLSLTRANVRRTLLTHRKLLDQTTYLTQCSEDVQTIWWILPQYLTNVITTCLKEKTITMNLWCLASSTNLLLQYFPLLWMPLEPNKEPAVIITWLF